jgi:hypothetical protein
VNSTIRWTSLCLAAGILFGGDRSATAQQWVVGPPQASPAPLPQPEVYRYGFCNPTVYRYALPYINAYAPPRIANRVDSALDRFVYGGSHTVMVPAPSNAPRDPYYAGSGQPIGHEKIWTSPNSYVYRPLYAAPPAVAGSPTPSKPAASPLAKPSAAPLTPTPAAPSTRPEAVQAGFAAPTGASSIPSGPELLPLPPAEEALSGPREF